MKAKFKKFSGGYEFRNFAGKPKNNIVDLGIPDYVKIPLSQGFGQEVPPVVKTGEYVKAGQIIGIDDSSISNPVHSSVNGIVEKIEAAVITIKSDGSSGWERLSFHTKEWSKLPKEKIEEMLYLSGVASLDKRGIPTSYKSSVISPDKVKNIIVCGVDSELYAPSVDAFLNGENIYHFIQGLKILNKIMPGAKIHLAINSHYKDIRKLSSLLAEYNDWIYLIPLKPKYPQEFDEVIVSTILGMQIPYNSSPANLGIVILSVQTILSVYEAIVEGKPVIERIVALGGTGFIENYYVKLRIGTTINYLIKDRMDTNKKSRIILDNPLTGVSISEPLFSIDRQCKSIIAIPEETTRHPLAFVRPGLKKDSYSRTFLSSLSISKKDCNTNLHGEERPCVSCTFCQEVCPVRIIPHLIYKYCKKDIIDESLKNLQIQKCIECNLCSYVCPSKLPISQVIKEWKEKLDSDYRQIIQNQTNGQKS